jgi:hypothetical protein
MRLIHTIAAVFYLGGGTATGYAAQEAAFMHPDSPMSTLLIMVCVSTIALGYLFAVMALHGKRKRWAR